ncbi:hypothetical protein K438DRAFT_1781939 [Mycena galopus ATCC 62051]|nr:hypothetical protein K438DRAFT_1781939 [Mycena galopus ATCC 62051]
MPEIISTYSRQQLKQSPSSNDIDWLTRPLHKWSGVQLPLGAKFDDSESTHPLTGSAYLSKFNLWPAEQKAEGGTNAVAIPFVIRLLVPIGCRRLLLPLPEPTLVQSRLHNLVEFLVWEVGGDICHGAGCSERQNENKDKMIKTREELASMLHGQIKYYFAKVQLRKDKCPSSRNYSRSIYVYLRPVNPVGKTRPEEKLPGLHEMCNSNAQAGNLISGGRSLGSYQGSLTPEFQVELCSLMFQSNLIGCAETSIEIQTNYWPWVKWGLDALGLRENGSNSVLLSPIGSLSFHANQLLNYQNRLNATSSTPTIQRKFTLIDQITVGCFNAFHDAEKRE